MQPFAYVKSSFRTFTRQSSTKPLDRIISLAKNDDVTQEAPIPDLGAFGIEAGVMLVRRYAGAVRYTLRARRFTKRIVPAPFKTAFHAAPLARAPPNGATSVSSR